MNLFNRIVMVLLTLLGVIASLALIFTALLYPETALADLRETIAILEDNLTMGMRIVVASLAALSAIVGFLILLLEVVPRSAKGVKLTGVTGSSAELTLDAVIDRIRFEAESVPSVRLARPHVTSRGKAIDVTLDLRTDPNIDVAAKTEEVSQIVRDTVENKLGIKLRRLRVYVHHEHYPKGAKNKVPAVQPAPAQPEASEPTSLEARLAPYREPDGD